MAIGFAQIHTDKNNYIANNMYDYFSEIGFDFNYKDNQIRVIDSYGNETLISKNKVYDIMSPLDSISIEFRLNKESAVLCTLLNYHGLIIESYDFDQVQNSDYSKFIHHLIQRFVHLINKDEAIGLVIDEYGYSENYINWNNFFLEDKYFDAELSNLIIGIRSDKVFNIVNKNDIKVLSVEGQFEIIKIT